MASDSGAARAVVSPSGRVPPHDLDAESAVLSAVLLERDALDRVQELIRPESFYSPANKRIFEACLALAQTGSPIDAVTVGGWLKSRKKLAEVGGVPYLGTIVDSVPSVANLEAYAAIVAKKARVRDMIATCQRIAAEGYGDVGDENAWLDKAALATSEVAVEGVSCPAKTIKEIIVERFRAIQAAAEKGQMLGYTTGFPSLDEQLGNAQPGQLWVEAAETGGGKTAFLLSCALGAAERTIDARALDDAGNDLGPRYGAVAASLIFSLEMTDDQVADRSMASRSGVPATLLQQARITADDWPALTAAAVGLGRLPVWVVERPGIRADEMRAIVRQVQNECARLEMPDGRPVVLAHVFTDYVQIMGNPEGPYEGRAQAVGSNVRALKNIAKDFKLVAHALSQFRKAEGAGKKRAGAREADAPAAAKAGASAGPSRRMDELMDSSEIQKTADVVLFFERDEASFSGGAEDAWVHIPKSRQGPKNSLPLIFHGARMRFYDPTEFGRGYSGS
jgi:replicative DNA helicase